jgi:hypothetical protein
MGVPCIVVGIPAPAPHIHTHYGIAAPPCDLENPAKSRLRDHQYA